MLSSQETIAAAAAVGAFVFADSAPSRETYLSALSKLQPIPASWTEDPAQPLVLFADSGGAVQRIVKHVLVDADADVATVPPENQDVVRDRIDDALNLIRGLDPGTAEAIDSCIGSFPYAIVEGVDGGSISSLIGAIWIGLGVDKPAEDFGELILHEFVHQSLFLEDMVRGVFVGGEEELAAPDAVVVTAIWKKSRGYDKGFHSAFVALSLYRYWSALGNPAKAEIYFEPSLRTIDQLVAKKENLTAHGQVLLYRLRTAFLEPAPANAPANFRA